MPEEDLKPSSVTSSSVAVPTESAIANDPEEEYPPIPEVDEEYLHFLNARSMNGLANDFDPSIFPKEWNVAPGHPYEEDHKLSARSAGFEDDYPPFESEHDLHARSDDLYGYPDEETDIYSRYHEEPNLRARSLEDDYHKKPVYGSGDSPKSFEQEGDWAAPEYGYDLEEQYSQEGYDPREHYPDSEDNPEDSPRYYFDYPEEEEPTESQEEEPQPEGEVSSSSSASATPAAAPTPKPTSVDTSSLSASTSQSTATSASQWSDASSDTATSTSASSTSLSFKARSVSSHPHRFRHHYTTRSSSSGSVTVPASSSTTRRKGLFNLPW